MRIGGLQKVSLIDYPGVISCVIFTQGCPWRCHFCHNPELVDPARFCPVLAEEEIFAFLEKRRGKLDAVVVSGGEPTLQADLLEVLEKIKSYGFLVKLDTSGVRPEVLEQAIDKKLVNYVAMDIKAPLHRYEEVIAVKPSIENIRKSIDILLQNSVPYEFRTTIVRSLHSLEDINEIAQTISGAAKYALQRFQPSKTINPLFLESETYSIEELQKLTPQLEKYVKQVVVR